MGLPRRGRAACSGDWPFLQFLCIQDESVSQVSLVIAIAAWASRRWSYGSPLPAFASTNIWRLCRARHKRHTFAVRLYQGTRDLYAVKVALRHENVTLA